jgi:anaerobic magnesium-protoporphyrin IX monomethyl ester cyclase
MKIALVLAPAWSREMPHLAIAMLSACLKEKSHSVSIFDLNNDFYYQCKDKYKTKWRKQEDPFWRDPAYISKFISENSDMIDKAVGKIASSSVSIIGFSVYCDTELMSLELARRIKKIDRKKIIVFGGFQCSRELRGNVFIKDPSVDIVVVGEGEETLVELVDMIERDGKVDFCKGALLKQKRSFTDCGDRPPIKNLNNLPFPDFKDFSLPLYEKPSALPFLSSRSCFQNCVYCTVKSFWNTYRSMNGERMFQELRFQLKNFNNVNEFFFFDALINGNIGELRKFCDLVIAAINKNIIPVAPRWCAQGIIRPEMNPELLMKMKKAGCYRMTYGIETGSQKVLDSMKYFWDRCWFEFYVWLSI